MHQYVPNTFINQLKYKLGEAVDFSTNQQAIKEVDGNSAPISRSVF